MKKNLLVCRSGGRTSEFMYKYILENQADEYKIVGILDLYNFVKKLNTEKRLEDVMNKDIVIATEDYDILNFNSFGQDILPFID